jgi:hypothetical protein
MAGQYAMHRAAEAEFRLLGMAQAFSFGPTNSHIGLYA